MKNNLLFILLILIPSLGFGQEAQDEAIPYEYDPVEKNLYPGYEKATLIVDYFYTSGSSTVERYSYEILVIDNMLALAFTSPETLDYNKISFETKRILNKEQIDSLNQVLINSKLKQIKTGIPRPYFSGYAQEVLIIKSEKLSIAGGMIYPTMFEDNSKEFVDQKIKTEIESNSSIGGNYEAVFKELNNLFVEKNDLLKKMYKYPSSTLTTPTFEVTIQPMCEKWVVDCDNVFYTGVNRKNKKSLDLKGQDKFHCPVDQGDGPGKTHCHHIGYEFRNSDIVYFVGDDGVLEAKQGSTVLLKEQGKWGSD